MFSRLVGKALVKLDIKDSEKQVAAKAAVLQCPNLAFPPPPHGTSSICARCLTLLSHFVYLFGDGVDYQPLSIMHSSAIRDVSHAVESNNAVARQDANECLICVKVFILFKAMQSHVSFEESWRESSSRDWNLSWAVGLHSYEMGHQGRLHVKFNVEHKGGYTWGLGGFMLHPDRRLFSPPAEQARDVDVDVPLYPALDNEPVPDFGTGPLDFNSTLSSGTLSSVKGWAATCDKDHPKCRKIFDHEGGGQPDPWFPDRLIQVRRKGSGALTARLVLKSSPAHFPQPVVGQLTYLSLSHCWGPPPDSNDPTGMGGRGGSVLTKETLHKWTDFLPVNEMPLAFRHAITICAWLGFEYIWIDSLCIMQDSKEDWDIQSAVMGDIYRFAFLNIAALASMSDYNGFIYNRDTRVVFGFRCSLARILGRNENERNQQGKQCILLRGQARLLWDFSGDVKGSTASNTPLFTRAWVYQERSLAPRTLGFANSTVYWTCDEHILSERPGWEGLHPEGLRQSLHRISDMVLAMNHGTTTTVQAQNDMFREFDYRWTRTISTYTECKLTKHTDKLIAISSVARQLASTHIRRAANLRYLAGFWDTNLLSQLAWITIVGKTTPPRKQHGDKEYSAPSWSWASVEAPVQPRSFLRAHSYEVPLADVLAADVELTTDFKYGSVKAGWIRLRGILHPISSGSSRNGSLTDAKTGQDFWFCSDTVEGTNVVRTGQARNLVWMPMLATFDTAISGKCIILMEVPAHMVYGGDKGFVRHGERAYRRMGTGNFGRSCDMLRDTDLVLHLGTYGVLGGGNTGQDIMKGFARREEGMQEFVLI